MQDRRNLVSGERWGKDRAKSGLTTLPDEESPFGPLDDPHLSFQARQRSPYDSDDHDDDENSGSDWWFIFVFVVDSTVT